MDTSNFKRGIAEIILHCSATREDRRYRFASCRHDHISNRHWSDIGYHYYIEMDGHTYQGRPLDKVGAHCQGHNAHSIGICYEGGLDIMGHPKDTRTPEQKSAILQLLHSLKVKYPNATIHGHNEFSSKACPCFDVAREYSEL